VLGCGVPSTWPHRPVATSTAPVVRKLLNLGVSVTGQGTTQPCNYPHSGITIRNPVAASRVAGGGCSGAAVAVANGEADLAIYLWDFLGSARIPAACMGVFAFVSRASAAELLCPDSSSSSSSSSTPGKPGSSRGTRSSGEGSSVEALGLVSTSLSLLRQVSSSLGLPGTSNLRHEVTQVVVAEDLFALCDPELSTGEPSASSSSSSSDAVELS